MSDRPLTIKQKTYVEGILQGLSGVKACMAAGYKGSETTLANVATQNYRKLYIKAEIDRRRAELEAKTDYDTEYLRKEHRRYADLAEKKADYATATRNIELIGKTFGAYIDKSVNLDLDIGRRPPDMAEVRRKNKLLMDAIDAEPGD